jgi:predicted nucleotidyltransferase
MKIPSTALATHQLFISNALPHLVAAPRLIGVTITGSWAENSMDEFSDLDLVIAVEPEHLEQVMSERQSIAASLGTSCSLLLRCHEEKQDDREQRHKS